MILTGFLLRDALLRVMALPLLYRHQMPMEKEHFPLTP